MSKTTVSPNVMGLVELAEVLHRTKGALPLARRNSPADNP
jgi:hypothetical protein